MFHIHFDNNISLIFKLNGKKTKDENTDRCHIVCSDYHQDAVIVEICLMCIETFILFLCCFL